LLTLRGHTQSAFSASFSPDGTRIVTASQDGTAKVWDAKTGAEALTLKGHTDWVHSASFSPDGTRIVTTSGDKTVRVWDAKTGAEALTLKGHTDRVYSASFSPDGTRIVTASFDLTARVWDAKAGAEALTLQGHKWFVYSASFSPDGTRIVTASWDRTARVWDARPLRRGWRLEWGDALLARGDTVGALAEYREALRLDPKDARAHGLLGLALQGKEDFDGAVAAYREALRLDPKQPQALANLPRAERLRDLLAGKAEPKSLAEGCEMADLCARPPLKRYADAVRLYERAFAADPKLAEVPPVYHRYSAACYAARAANGEGVGAPTQPRERATLRAKALAWLRADLALVKATAGSKRPEDRRWAANQLAHWQEDEDLAETRPKAKREGWTEQEAADWDQLWSAVLEAFVEAQKL
jgi:tetratricopeptide (TPR) repeat protein